jgi:endonuclease YncB( thermonuclease family)
LRIIVWRFIADWKGVLAGKRVNLPIGKPGTKPAAIIAMGAVGIALLSGLLVASINSPLKQSAAKRQADSAGTIAGKSQKAEIANANFDARTPEAKQIPTIEPKALHRFKTVEVVPSDGFILADGRKLKIYGLTLPPRTRACRRANGERWACGLRSIVALYNLVTHSSMICEIDEEKSPHPAKCKVGPIDVTATMLRNGWGVLTPGTKDKVYIEAQTAAQAANVGIWSDTLAGQGEQRRR